MNLAICAIQNRSTYGIVEGDQLINSVVAFRESTARIKSGDEVGISGLGALRNSIADEQ